MNLKIHAVNGYGREENVEHIFFECPLALVAWSKVLRWLGFANISHNSVELNFVYFAGLSNGGREFKERFSVI